MADIYELISQKNKLPRGFVYKKEIKGKTYFYHQYSLNGKKFSHLIKDNELKKLEEEINKRVEIEKQIKEMLGKGNRNLVLSNNARRLTGDVLSKDKVVASFDNGQLISLNEKLCPLIIKRTKSLEPFLKCRVIDSGRTNSRLLKKALNITESDDALVSLCSYAVSISDDYWFKPKHSKLKYEDVCFNNDLFFNLSLKGIMTVYPNKICLTPELTTGGGYEKGWKNIDGEWWLYKVGTKNEIFSELFYSHFFELIGLPTAHYEYDNGYIRTKNFATDYNFEPIVSVAGEDDSYEHVFNVLNDIDYKLAKEYIRLCFFDVVLNNIDRHNENCGLLRDKNTGNIVSLAPNYDDNLCLVARQNVLSIDTKEGFLKHFASVINKNTLIKQALKECNIPCVERDVVEKCLADMPYSVDATNIVEYVMFRYEYLVNIINK